jgi:glycosyltransferase involved in cell wall biosynthesis
LNPLVSIVTPSYNQGRFIGQTIESVLTQDYAPIEYMVIDGGSTDETIAILKSYGNRFYWISEKDKGQSNAINKGWSRSRGEILAWLNSDDIYLPGAISKAVAFLQDSQKAGAVYGEGYHIEEDGRILERYPTEPFSWQRLKEKCYICQPTVFIRKTVLEEVGFLNENLQYCMDYDLWFRIARKYVFGYVPEYLACTRFHSETKTLGQRVKVHKEILAVVRRHTQSVPPSWIYGYGHAFLERYFDRSNPWENLFFVIALIGLSMGKFLQYNHRIPFAEYRRWWKSLRQNFKSKLLLRSSREGKNNGLQIVDDKSKRN